MNLNLISTDRQVSVWNLKTAELLFIIDAGTGGNIPLVLNSQQFSTVPCEVAVYTSGRFQAMPVSGVLCTNAPQRIPAIVSQFPSAVIQFPAPGLQIGVGTSAFFAAAPVPGALYFWSFGGATADAFTQIPGAVLFNTPGTYNVMLNVRNPAGLIDPTPAIQTIVVNP
jgi:hypothetical protein